MMVRRLIRRVPAIALCGLLLASSAALAALPKAGAHFSGGGSDYLNNAASWVRAAGEHVSFRVAADRRRILSFRGSYFYYCGSATAVVSARWIDVTPSGHFDYRFSAPIKGASGNVTSHSYAEISGQFLGAGTTATLSYLVDFDEGKRLARPYSTASPHTLGCASWVRATVRAH